MLFPTPTAEDILDDSRLLPAQVSAFKLNADVITDIEGRLPSEMARVETDLLNLLGEAEFPFTEEFLAARLPSQDVAEENERIQTLAGDAAKKLALSELFELSGQLAKAYPDKAARFMTEYKNLMAALSARIGFITGKTPEGEPNTPPASTARRIALHW